MSYWVTVGDWSENYTSNVTGMWFGTLGKSLGDLIEEGHTGKTLAPYLLEGIRRFLMDFPKFEKMNPANGWGDARGALDYLIDIYIACIHHPEEEVSVSR